MTNSTDLAPGPALQLTLDGVELCETGATITGPIDPAAVVAGLHRLSRAETSTRWWVGDLFLALAAHEDEAAAYRAVAPLGYSASWLSTSIEVARRIPLAHRHAGLAWGHHEQVARDCIGESFAGDELDHDDHMAAVNRWLDQAAEAGWTIREMTAHVDAWEHRAQLQLPGTGGPAPRPFKMPPAVTRRIGEVLAMDADAWVLVHPSTGEVRRFERNDAP